MTRTPDRQSILAQVEQAQAAGIRLEDIAKSLAISARTLRRWRITPDADDQRVYAIRPEPANALTAQQRQAILNVCNQSEFASKTPAEIVPELADRGEYLGSERTYYRVLRAHRQLTRRGLARAPQSKRPPATHRATAPCEVWVWDITWLMGPVRGIYYRFYIIMDLFSRKIVASEVWANENAENSEALIHRAALSEQLASGKKPILHGDNGAPLKAGTVLALMHTLGIKPSHSRPRVSNDNAHAEALFRTAKYHPSLDPNGFDSLKSARQWACEFVRWYNTEHKHSAIGFVTPEQKHNGEDEAILTQRREVYERARAEHPERWIKGQCRKWQAVTSTCLNPISPRNIEKELKKSA